jgi:hypothetical protein
LILSVLANFKVKKKVLEPAAVKFMAIAGVQKPACLSV